MSDNKLDFLSWSPEDQEAARPKLLAEAEALGMSVHSNTSTVKLFERIKQRKEELKEEAKSEEEQIKEKLAEIKLVPQSELNLDHSFEVANRQYFAGELIRCIVTPTDPIKRDWTGEIIEAGNDARPVIKKMIPFGEPFHVPRFILNVLKDKEYLHSKKVKNRITGKEERVNRLIPAYNIQELTNLTEAEITAIADKQLAMKRHDQ